MTFGDALVACMKLVQDFLPQLSWDYNLTPLREEIVLDGQLSLHWEVRLIGPYSQVHRSLSRPRKF